MNVHTPAPRTVAARAAWEAELAALQDLAVAAHGPLVLAGDLNATRAHGPMAALLDTGLREAHRDGGADWTASWPRTSPLGPLIRIDHVLV